MSRPKLNIVTAGATVGFLETFGIWFVPQEPYPNFIVAAGVIKGVLTALLISSSIDRQSPLSRALGMGALYAFLISAVVFLAKGAWLTWDAPFVVPSGAIAGLILGPIVRRLNPTH